MCLRFATLPIQSFYHAHCASRQIKGTHNAMKSGILAAETAFSALTSPSTSESDSPTDMAPYEDAIKGSFIWKELKQVRNLRPSFHNPMGIWGGMAYSGMDSLLLRGRVPWTFRNKKDDYAFTKKAR